MGMSRGSVLTRCPQRPSYTLPIATEDARQGHWGRVGHLVAPEHPRHAGYPPLRKSSTALLFLRQTPGHRSQYVPYQSSPFLCHHFMSS